MTSIQSGSVTTSSPASTPTMAGSGSGQRPLRLRRVNHADEIISGFGKLLKTEAMTDVTLICGGGQTIRAHRVILSTFSPYFKSIFEAQPFAHNPCQYPVIVIKDLGLNELKTIIEFIYKGEVSVSRDKLSAVLQAAKALEVSGLSELKVENFGVSCGSSGDSTPSPGPMGVNGPASSPSPVTSYCGSLTGIGSMGGNALNVSGPKRSQEVTETTIYGGTGPDPSLKKMRISLDNNGGDLSPGLGSLGSSAISGLSGLGLSTSQLVSTNFGTAGGLTGSGLIGETNISFSGVDGVRSLLQQPPRLPHAFQQIRQHQQQQQQQLQQLQQLQQKSNHQKHNSLQQLIQQQQRHAQRQQQHSQQSQRHLQLQQQQLKQQILQQQLMRNSNQQQPSKQHPMFRGPQGVHFMQFQQRIRQQIQDKQKQSQSSALQERLLQKPLLQQKQLMSWHHPVNNQERDRERELQAKVKVEQDANERAEKENKDHEEGVDKDGEDMDDDVEVEVIINKEQRNTNSKESQESPEKHDNQQEEAENNGKDNNNEGEADKEENNNEKGTEQTVIPIEEEDEATGGPPPLDPEGSTSSLPASPANGSRRKRAVGSSILGSAKSNNEGEPAADESVDGYLEEDLTEETETPNDQEQDHEEDEEYEIEIDKDMIFQRQQQLRLQQLQKQQQYQQQLQLQLQQEQEEQEQRLLEYHQSLQQATSVVDDQEHGQDADDSLEDNGTGFGFDWQEGFTDEVSFGSEGREESSLPLALPAASNQMTTPLATPDFLQPRGPGRPRKGNKAQEISPCPECNKVFVRPDVLKLHYRSVHLNERHPCNLCPKIFKWPGDLSKHKRTKHPEAYPAASAVTASN